MSGAFSDRATGGLTCEPMSAIRVIRGGWKRRRASQLRSAERRGSRQRAICSSHFKFPAAARGNCRGADIILPTTPDRVAEPAKKSSQPAQPSGRHTDRHYDCTRFILLLWPSAETRVYKSGVSFSKLGVSQPPSPSCPTLMRAPAPPRQRTAASRLRQPPPPPS